MTTAGDSEARMRGYRARVPAALHHESPCPTSS